MIALKGLELVLCYHIMKLVSYLGGLLIVLGLGVASKLPKGGGGRSGVKRLPIGENQKMYCEYLGAGLGYDAAAALEDSSIVVGVGPAGCGKTLFACNAAVSALMGGHIDKIVITRPTVAVDEELGFLPGTLENKMDPWLRPVFDVLGEFYSAGEVKRMVDDGVIEISPLAYMRGRTFRRSFIIADEMQNSSPNQMLMMLTRIGEGSKMVITGDLLQSDRAGANGLADLYGRLKRRGSGGVRGIQWVEFGTEDVQRSAVVAVILGLYQESSAVKKRPTGNDDSAMAPHKESISSSSVWGL